MAAKTKLAQKRLTLRQLAEKLGTISKACRLDKVSRGQFYVYNRAFQQHGLDGLIYKPPIISLPGLSAQNPTALKLKLQKIFYTNGRSNKCT